MLARFSTVAGELGSPDTWRDVRGFALKFYTQDGNFDIVGNNTPTFFVRDPMKFPRLHPFPEAHPRIRVSAARTCSGTTGPSPPRRAPTRSPMSWAIGGLPKSWRHMNGYSSHTYMWVNEAGGEKFWVKYHFLTEQGLEFLTNAEADELAGKDGDYHRRDLFDSISRGGDFPSWRVEVQIMPYEDAKTYRFNPPFDLTKTWSKKDYPRIPVGRFTLNQNPVNHFAQIEQAAFSPLEHRSRHRHLARQDAHGPRVLLPGRAAQPSGHELQPAACEPSGRRHQLL